MPKISELPLFDGNFEGDEFFPMIWDGKTWRARPSTLLGVKGDQGPPGRDASEMAFNVPPVTATEGQTIFTIGHLFDPVSIVVSENGFELSLGVDYYALNETQIAFTDACEGGEEVVIRGFVPGNTTVEHYTPQMFGALGTGVANDAPAFQRLFDFLRTVKNGGTAFIPSPLVAYRWLDQVIWRSQAPLRVAGEACASLPFAYEGQVAIVYEGPVGSAALVLETDGANEGFSARGLGVERMLFYRPTPEPAGSGGVAIKIAGCVRGEVTDIVSYGFDCGSLLVDDNPLSAGATSIRSGRIVARNVAAFLCATRRMAICGSAEIVVEYADLKATMIPGYRTNLYIGPGSNGGRCDGVQVNFPVCIAGTDNPADFSLYGIEIVDALWVILRDPNVERAANIGVKIYYNAPDLPPSKWSKIFVILDDEGVGRWARSTSRKRSSASCVRRRSCWRRAVRFPMRVGDWASRSRPITAGARNMGA